LRSGSELGVEDWFDRAGPSISGNLRNVDAKGDTTNMVGCCRSENGSGILAGYRIRIVQIPIFRIRIQIFLYLGRIRVMSGTIIRGTLKAPNSQLVTPISIKLQRPEGCD
jgi:hypothetical protein